MEERKFRYDAFISYRHTELDKFVAENLIKELEAYKLPKNVAKKLKGKKTKIERVFRDREELPLTNNLEEPIVEALKDSEWLIVICSPRLPESVWCKKEIETFISLRGRDHVLAVLIEGEPSESFPEELLYRIEEVRLADGTTQQVKMPVEPLAADFRGKDKKAVAKAMKTEKLRLLAAMFGVPFDDLRQRHRERRLRRIATFSSIIGAACLLFGVYCAFTAMRIQEQKEQIEEQSTQILAQTDEILQQNEEIKQKSAEIIKQNEAIQKQNDELALRQAKALAESAEYYLEDGNRSLAIATAVEALTESGGIAMPYTPEAEMILTESTRAYDIGEVYKAQFQFETTGKIEYIKESVDMDTLAIYDDAGFLTLYDVEKREVIEIIGAEEYDSFGSYGFTFLGEDRFVYINIDGNACVYDLETGSVSKKLEEDIFQVDADMRGNYLLLQGYDDCYQVYDGNTLEKLGTTPVMPSDLSGNYQLVSSEGILADVSITMEEGNSTYNLFFVDLNTMELLAEYPIGSKVPEEMQVKDGIAYLLLGEYIQGYMDCNTHVVALSVTSGEVLWETVIDREFPGLLNFPDAADATDMLVTTGESVILMNMQNGEISLKDSIEAAPIATYKFANSADFLVFCENGDMLSVNKAVLLTVWMNDRFECKTERNKFIFFSDYGITVNEYNHNILTLYTAKTGAEVVKLEDTFDVMPEAEMTYGDKAHEIAESLGLDRPEFVNSVFYSQDKQYCFIKYWDGLLVIYKEGTGIVSTMEIKEDISNYIDKDSTGKSYLLGARGCYILDKDMKPVAWVDNAGNVDTEEQKIYLKRGSHYYEAPIYTLEELLEIAKESME